MNTEDICLLLYTHSEFEDLWKINFDYIDKSFPFLKRYVAIDNKNSIINKKDEFKIDKIIQYNDGNTYAEKMITILNEIDTAYVFFTHDNNIIYKNDHTIFFNLFNKLKEINGDRLVFELEQSLHKSPIIKVDGENAGLQLTTDYYYYFNVQTGIWKTSSYLDIFKTFPQSTYRTIEDSNIQEYVRSKYKVYRLATMGPIFKSVGFIFPTYFHFLHITMRRQWVSFHIFQDLQEDWKNLFKEYKLDSNKRGWRTKY